MKKVIATSIAAIALTGCASIFNGPTQAVTINSVPDGADVSVTNSAGEKIHTGVTPVTLTLKRGAGYFKSESYTIKYAKAGFAAKELTISGSMSGWYIGNILFGGLIGMLAVDPVTGAMYVLPETVSQSLDADAPKTGNADGSLKVVSTDSLTPAQMKEARLIAATAK
jgi:hypothetical protein